MIMASLAVKRQYIEQDPTETHGIRDALNLGHTFAHALESVGNLSTWSHGEAVAWGVVKALQAGVAEGITDKVFAQRYRDLFSGYGFGIDWKITDVPAFLAALESDKKKRGSMVRFVLMEGQGKHVLRPLPVHLVAELVS
jgi:3-dehydroquinate synthase